LVDASGKVLWNKLLDTNLLDAKTGKPYGTGIGDMYDHEIPLLKQYQFATQGLYTLKFKHQMRNDTLPDVMAIGVKVLESTQ
jgi:gliding motility-associated lipoprotein GldH